MTLSKRLAVIADITMTDAGLGPGTVSVADVGCGHGLLSAELIRSGKAAKVVASDVNPGPLASARETISRLGVLASRVDVRLGGGLSALGSGECQVCVIAGMGGLSIINILSEYPDKALRFKQLILSPGRDAALLRRYLHGGGYMIHDEQTVLDRGIYYSVIDARPGAESPYTDAEYAFGKPGLDRKDVVLREYIERELKKTRRRLLTCTDNGIKAPNRLLSYQYMCEDALDTYNDAEGQGIHPRC